MRPLLLAILAFAPAAAFAQPTTLPSENVWAERRCTFYDKPDDQYRFVCYNTNVTKTIDIRNLSFNVTRERVKVVDCQAPVTLPADPSDHDKVAAEYCPQIQTLARAPFLN